MKLTVHRCEDCGMYHLEINDQVIMTCYDEGVVQRNARIYEGALVRGRREGVKMLMDEIGYGEENARRVYDRLKLGMSGPRTLN